MRYIPLTNSDREAMLKELGVDSIEDLFSSIPASVRFQSKLPIPSRKTEAELVSYFQDMGNKSQWTRKDGWLSFLGAGCYDHFIPTVVDMLSSRGEFETAYTPYQPEVSQGTLQAIFEFQSMVASLFEMEVANASMYDGASALAEAAMMALRLKRKKYTIAMSKAVHPDYQKVVESYLKHADVHIVHLDVGESGQTVLGDLSDDVATVIVQQPNFYGVIEDIESISGAVHAKDGLCIVGTTETVAFGMLHGPGAKGADIVAGEGQSFGNYMSYGGPHVGLFSTRAEFVRQMPGRLVGKAKDSKGRDGYVLTLATREQHIRRDKATSNICTNHSLCALRASIHMALLGKQGIAELAQRNTWGAQKLANGLCGITGVSLRYTGAFFNEFVLKLPISSEAFLSGMETEKVLAGVPLSRWDDKREHEILVTATEMQSQKDIEQYIASARRVL